MKTITKFTFLMLLLFSAFSCNAKETTKEPTTTKVSVSSDKVEAYYFHFSARCVTCKTVEAEAIADLKALYGDKVKLQSVNLDEKSGQELAEKIGVSGQTLLIVKGKTKVNITNEGFMYAKSNPEKFKSIIKEKVDPLMK